MYIHDIKKTYYTNGLLSTDRLRKIMYSSGGGRSYYIWPRPDMPSPFFIPDNFYEGTYGGSYLGLFLLNVPQGTTFTLNCHTDDCEGEGGSKGNIRAWIPANSGMSLNMSADSERLSFTATTNFTGWIVYGDSYDFTLTGIASVLFPYIKGLYSRSIYDTGCGTSVNIDYSLIPGLLNCDIQFVCFGDGNKGTVGIYPYETLSYFNTIKYFIPLPSCWNNSYDLSGQNGITSGTFAYTVYFCHTMGFTVASGVDWDVTTANENHLTITRT